MKRKKLFLGTIFILIILVVLSFFAMTKEKNSPNSSDEIPFAFIEPQKLIFPENVCNIKDFGAIPDEKTLNTKAFQKAINICSQKGGGKVLVPEGKWLTGSIHLQSNIDLHLENGSEIIFSDNPKDYLPVVFTRIEGMELYNYSPFVYAKDAKNIAITGSGILNGQGSLWQTWKKGEKSLLEKLNGMIIENIPSEKRIFGAENHGLRPSFIQFVNCRNINLMDFQIINSPRWTIHPIYSENILMKNLNVNTLGFNSDGVVIDSSKNVLIENSTFMSGDDTISIKSGLNEDGWRVNRPSENIVIRNCNINDGHSGIAIGSEMSGGVQNVLLENIKLDNVDQGIRAKSTTGRGGFVENIWIRNITMGNIKNTALKFDLTYPASTLKPSKDGGNPIFKNIYIDNVLIKKTGFAIELDGLKPSLISNVNISNIKASAEKGIYVSYGQNVNFSQIEIDNVIKLPIFKIKDSVNVNY